MGYKDLPRQSALNERHLALGSKLDADWNGMPIPQTYATDPYEETTLVRSRAGLFDVWRAALCTPQALPLSLLAMARPERPARRWSRLLAPQRESSSERA